MPLRSQLLRGDAKLEAAAVADAAHIVPGANGDHVRKIQQALMRLDGAALVPDGGYGPKTSAAVLAYKRKRNIVNLSYQTTADGIVGRMTMAALDAELVAKDDVPPVGQACRLEDPCPLGVGAPTARRNGTALAFAVSDAGAAGASDADVMAEARRFARQCLWDARGDLMSVSGSLRANVPLVPAQVRTFDIAKRWLNLDPADTAACAAHLDTASDLMLRNHNLKVSGGTDVQLTRAPGERYHALSIMNSPDRGLKCGDPFFDSDGPNCRRDVVVHEFFHMIGVHHGGGALLGPTVRTAITTPAQALDSADNLAQLVAELRTFKSPNTDACVRPGD